MSIGIGVLAIMLHNCIIAFLLWEKLDRVHQAQASTIRILNERAGK